MVYHGVSLIELEVGMPSYAFLQSCLCPGDAILGGDHCSHAEAGQDRFCGSTWQLHPCHCEDETGLRDCGKVIKIQTGGCVLDMVEWQLMQRCTNLIISSSYIFSYLINRISRDSLLPMKHGPGTYILQRWFFVSQLLRRQAMLVILRIEGLSDDLIPGLEIPTGTPLVYELDKDQTALNISSPRAHGPTVSWHSPKPNEIENFVLPQFGLQCVFFWCSLSVQSFDLGVLSSSLFPYQDRDITFATFEHFE